MKLNDDNTEINGQQRLQLYCERSEVHISKRFGCIYSHQLVLLAQRQRKRELKRNVRVPESNPSSRLEERRINCDETSELNMEVIVCLVVPF